MLRGMFSGPIAALRRKTRYGLIDELNEVQYRFFHVLTQQHLHTSIPGVNHGW